MTITRINVRSSITFKKSITQINAILDFKNRSTEHSRKEAILFPVLCIDDIIPEVLYFRSR